MADIVEKVLFPGWQKNLSVTVRQFKYLAGGTANCSASPCMTLQTAPTGKAASILTVIGISRRMWPTYFSTFSTVSAMNKHAGHSRTTARAGVVGLRIFRWEIRHRQIIQEIDRNFGVSYVNRKILAYFQTTNPRNLVLFF